MGFFSYHAQHFHSPLYKAFTYSSLKYCYSPFLVKKSNPRLCHKNLHIRIRTKAHRPTSSKPLLE
ncbi:hypothetical protein HMPREF1869_01826 [Bacteroidales bacterium KA00251]|nr:hypothetical protein HMPREF1869_01826 [Bacteroidales bacterium KA00251]